MNRVRGAARFKLLTLLLLATLPQMVFADLQMGRDYGRIDPPQHTNDPAKIEVIEFFSYACPHCNELQPIISKWAAALPKDVEFIRVPVEFGRPEWGALGKTYYALQFSGDISRLDGAIFRAIHEQHVRLTDEASIGAWLATLNVDRKKFTELFNSFSVVSKKAQADQMAVKYKVEGVPALYIDGKYQLIAAGSRSYVDWPALLDQLVAKARAEKH
jgi:thiol:disulfide interchange protein DsbA